MAVAICRDIDGLSGKTIAAIDRPPLTGIKWNGSDYGAFSAFGANLDPLPHTCSFGQLDRFETAILGLFTFFATFWRILQLLIAEEALLPDRPYKILSAVDALYRRISEIARGID